MTAPIGPGDWVECINDSPDELGLLPIKCGCIYQVCEVLLGETHDGDLLPSLTLFGVESDDVFDPSRFRPIWRGEKSLIQTLLEPIKEDAPERETEAV